MATSDRKQMRKIDWENAFKYDPDYTFQDDPPDNPFEDEPLKIDEPVQKGPGGPTTPEGKQRSSKNSTKHGCRAKTVVLPGESQEEFDDLYQRWHSIYPPDSEAAAELVENLVLKKWYLLRNERRYIQLEAELSIFNYTMWTAEQHRIFGLTQRYKTSAERAASKAMTDVEAFFKNRRAEETHHARSRKQAFGHYRDLRRIYVETEKSYKKKLDEARSAGIDTTKHLADFTELQLKNEANLVAMRDKLMTLEKERALKEISSPAHTSPKLFRITPYLEQVARIKIDNGLVRTKLHPSNEQITTTAAQMDPAPEFLYRRLEFPSAIPDSYAWITTHPKVRETGGFLVQKIPFAAWLNLIEVEQANPEGTLSPVPTSTDSDRTDSDNDNPERIS